MLCRKIDNVQQRPVQNKALFTDRASPRPLTSTFFLTRLLDSFDQLVCWKLLTPKHSSDSGLTADLLKCAGGRDQVSVSMRPPFYARSWFFAMSLLKMPSSVPRAKLVPRLNELIISIIRGTDSASITSTSMVYFYFGDFNWIHSWRLRFVFIRFYVTHLLHTFREFNLRNISLWAGRHRHDRLRHSYQRRGFPRSSCLSIIPQSSMPTEVDGRCRRLLELPE